MEPVDPESQQEIERERLLRETENPMATVWTAVRILRIGSRVALVFMAVILVLGFLKLCVGALEFFGHSPAAGDGDYCWKLLKHCKTKHASIATMLESLEYFLLAPLCYLQLKSLTNYLAGFLSQNSSEAVKRVEILVSVKALSISLLIAILATHLVGQFLSVEGDARFPWEKVVCGMGVLLCFITYFIILESKLKHEKDGETKHPK